MVSEPYWHKRKKRSDKWQNVWRIGGGGWVQKMEKEEEGSAAPGEFDPYHRLRKCRRLQWTSRSFSSV
jgi:hypothetical protein